jgi:hypothetical protein
MLESSPCVQVKYATGNAAGAMCQAVFQSLHLWNKETGLAARTSGRLNGASLFPSSASNLCTGYWRCSARIAEGGSSRAHRPAYAPRSEPEYGVSKASHRHAACPRANRLYVVTNSSAFVVAPSLFRPDSPQQLALEARDTCCAHYRWLQASRVLPS